MVKDQKSCGAGWTVSLAERRWHMMNLRSVTAITISAFLCAISPAPAQNDATDAGEKIFMQNNCFVCHGQQGFGGLGPAFRNDPFLKLDDYVAGQIIMGRGVMPSFGDKLNDRQIAAVASYIRNSWGNRFGDLRPEEVAQVRSKLGAAASQAANPSQQTTGSGR
jgi:mono/diheme cytochrome c family protein